MTPLERLEQRVADLEKRMQDTPKREEVQADVRRLHDKKDHTIGIVKEALGEVRTHLTHQGQRVENMEELLFEGNGQKPLKERVALLEAFREKDKENEEKREKADKELKKHRWGIIGAGLVAVLGWLWEFFKEWMQQGG